jgi:DNA polymerase IV
MDRQIVCYQIPAFEIAVARLQDASLRDRPVAVVPSHTPRALIHELSSQAKHEGLSPGMSLDYAQRLCPTLRVLPTDPVRVQVAHQSLLKVIGRFAPVWEALRPGHVFLDLTGTTKLFGPAVDAAARIEREVIDQYGLPGAMGIGSNKLVSRVAAAVMQPPQLCDVRAGSEGIFFSPLPVTVLPGLGRSSANLVLTLLQDLNLRTLGEIAEIPLPQLAVALGRQAALLHRWANGIDSSPVMPAIQRPIVEISRVLTPDAVDDGELLAQLYGLLEELCRTLRRQQRICRRLALILWHSDHVEVSRHRTFAVGSYWEAQMFPYLKELFFGCFKRRVRIRRMALRAEVLAPPEEQLSLFDLNTSENQKQKRRERLSLALDCLRERFGPHTIYWGATRVAPNGRPGRAQRLGLRE